MRRPVQFFLEIRVGDGHQAAGALSQRPPLELSSAEFSDDHIHVAACGGAQGSIAASPQSGAAPLSEAAERGLAGDLNSTVPGVGTRPAASGTGWLASTISMRSHGTE